MKTVSLTTAMAACFCTCAAAQDQQNDAGRDSYYTSLQDCPVIRSAPEEAGYSRSACPGLGGYGLELVDADARHNLIVVAPDGQEHSLRLPSLSGGGFSSLGERVEWRGITGNGKFRPDAMIVRHEVIEDANEPERPTSYLLAVSLEGTPCLAARIAPGDAQNERAREAADGLLHCMTDD